MYFGRPVLSLLYKPLLASLQASHVQLWRCYDVWLQCNISPMCVCHRYGLESIPEAWLKKYPRAEEVLGYIESIIVL